MKRFLANYWFAPIYVGLALLALRDHVFTPRYIAGLVIVFLFSVVSELRRRRKARRMQGPANDY